MTTSFVVVAHQRRDVAPPQPLEVGVLLGARLVGAVGVLELDRHYVGGAAAQLALQLQIGLPLRVALSLAVHTDEVGGLVLA